MGGLGEASFGVYGMCFTGKVGIRGSLGSGMREREEANYIEKGIHEKHRANKKGVDIRTT